jgi:universal stress protein E
MTRPIRRILVAVKDVRSGNSHTLKKAAQLARALGASIDLFHALTEPVPVDAFLFASQGLKKFETDARLRCLRCLRRLDLLAAPMRRNGLEVSTSAVWDFPAQDALIRHALRTKADLVVAQRHASRHVAPWFLRYTDWELLRRSPVPVLLIKTTRQYTSTNVLAAIDPSHAFAKTASLDDAILRLGFRAASATRGELHVVHTYVPTLVDTNLTELDTHAARIAQRGFAKALRKARLGKLAPRQHHVLAGYAVDAIPALAKKLRCGIVAMGAVSRSGLKRLAVGNTAEQLLDDLPCDLLIVKPRGFDSGIPRRARGSQRVVVGPPAGML